MRFLSWYMCIIFCFHLSNLVILERSIFLPNKLFWFRKPICYIWHSLLSKMTRIKCSILDFFYAAKMQSLRNIIFHFWKWFLSSFNNIFIHFNKIYSLCTPWKSLMNIPQKRKLMIKKKYNNNKVKLIPKTSRELKNKIQN